MLIRRTKSERYRVTELKYDVRGECHFPRPSSQELRETIEAFKTAYGRDGRTEWWRRLKHQLVAAQEARSVESRTTTREFHAHGQDVREGVTRLDAEYSSPHLQKSMLGSSALKWSAYSEDWALGRYEPGQALCQSGNRHAVMDLSGGNAGYRETEDCP